MSEARTKDVDLVTVALRQNAVFIPDAVKTHTSESDAKQSTLTLAVEMAGLGFGLDEALFEALNSAHDDFKADLLLRLRTIMGMDKNWTPLVKDWRVPTGETLTHYFSTHVATILKTKGTELPCGHIIPDGSFPLERYNGCPFCKTPFEFGEIENTGQGSQLKVLTLWSVAELQSFFKDLLLSKTPLDGTQADSLKCLAGHLALPSPLIIAMKETMAMVVDFLVVHGKDEQAGSCLRTPTDVLRYLWYKRTGFAQLIEPQTVIRKQLYNRQHRYSQNPRNQEQRKQELTNDLKLKYSRPEGRRVAKWINALPMDTQSMAESMHPNRGMWVRFIRALRLVEFSKRPECVKLKQLLDAFHNNTYEVWLGKVNSLRLSRDLSGTVALLKERPGAFARSLFSNMLWFGDGAIIEAFSEIADKVPARLLLTLAMYSELYFDPLSTRHVRPRGGNSKKIPANPLLTNYSEEQRSGMIEGVQSIALGQMNTRFAKSESASDTMYIDPMLLKMPLPIGDRSESIQSLPVALMGSRFPVEGNCIRLFMCWGKGLAAQNLDMDLSCKVAYDEKHDSCSYSRLTSPGCQHSGDIMQIPEKVGTAEYIEIDLAKLKKLKARFVAFTCNAYSVGELAMDMVVGWMSSKHPMEISERTGVAYDPSCVQHQVEISQTLSKGMVFGVLDVAASEVIWLEMPFGGQVVQDLNIGTIKSLLKRLDSKMTIGQLLKVKAAAQNIQIVTELDRSTPPDEVYDMDWARNSAAVTQLMVD